MDPQEILDIHRRQHEQQVMAHQSTEHEIRDFYNSLTKEQLETLKMLLAAFTDTDIGLMQAAMHLGRVREVLDRKHNVCSCSQDHGTAEDLLKGAPEVKSVQSDAESALEGVIGEASSKRYKLLTEYRVRASSGDRSVSCIECGMEYISLSDRMLREPDNCPGCHIKSSQG